MIKIDQYKSDLEKGLIAPEKVQKAHPYAKTPFQYVTLVAIQPKERERFCC